jgi:membrane protease YdiL (CAAX protease family)
LLGEAITYQGLTLGVLLSVTTLIFGRYDASPELLGYRFPGWNELFLSAATIIPVYAGVLVLYGAFQTFAPGYHLAGNAKDVFGVGSRHMSALDLIGLIAFVGIEVPLTEETLFRGIMYQGFRHTASQRLSRVWAVLVAALVSGLIFGLAHGEIRTLPILWFLGVVLAYVFQRTNSVYGSAALHAMVNTSAALVYFLHG